MILGTLKEGGREQEREEKYERRDEGGERRKEGRKELSYRPKVYIHIDDFSCSLVV